MSGGLGLPRGGGRDLPKHLVGNGFSHVALLTRLIVQPVGLHICHWRVANLVHKVLQVHATSRPCLSQLSSRTLAKFTTS